MKILCEATGKTVYENYRLAEESKNKHYYDILKRKVNGKRYKHRRGRPHRCRIYQCDYCGGFHLTHIKVWLPESKKRIKEIAIRNEIWKTMVQMI